MTWKRKQKEFVCGTCGKDFDKESQLRKHMKDAHKLHLVRPVVVYSDIAKEILNGRK